MPDTTAKIRAKQLGNTGVTDELATKMADAGAGYHMAIVEMKIDEVHNKADGDTRRVDLVITQVEPATDDRLDDHLRELTRALHGNRRLHDEDDQPQLDGVGDVEPTVDEVVNQGKGVLEDTEAGDS